MISPALSRSLLGLCAALLLTAACSDDAAPARPSAGGAGGTPGAAGKGPAGTAGVAGRGPAGMAGAAGKGPAGTAGASGSPLVGGAGGTQPTGGQAAGGSPPIGASGSGGQAGSSVGGAPLSDAAPVAAIPTGCFDSNGEFGCCGPDGNAYRFLPTPGTVEVDDCGGASCGWSAGSQTYRCGGKGSEPSGNVRRACGLPYMPGTACPDSFCSSDAQCDPALWGVGARCSKGACVRCKTSAECATGLVCNAGIGLCHVPACTTDAQCAALDETTPACHPKYHICVECQNDTHCKDADRNACFVDTCGCKGDAACAASPLGTRCDPFDLRCGCKTSADCPRADAPLCVDEVCSACSKDADCAGTPARPHCVQDGGVSLCTECRMDTDCKADGKPFCNQGTCLAGCQTSFSCDAPTPVCEFAETGVGACGPAPACQDDDAHEEGDDNPHTAKVLLGTDTPVTGKICGLPGERDHYPFAVANGEDVILTLTSVEPAAFVLLTDDRGTLLGMSLHQSPDVVHVRALPGGIYYAVVGIAVDDGTATSSAYALSRGAVQAGCTSDGHCASTTSTEVYRGRCDAGACRFIEGAGLLKAEAPCDSDKDCASGFCSGYAFARHPGEQSRCSLPCDAPGPLGVEPTSSLCAKGGLYTWWCTTHEEVNRCVPPCKGDEDCPLTDPLDTPVAGQPWRHMKCSDQARCEAVFD